MRKALSIVLYVLAGLFVNMLCILAFVNEPTIAKWAIVAGFSLPALIFLCIGLAVNRFQRWRRDVGIVLMSCAGYTAFEVFTFVCLLMTDEFKNMLQPNTLDFFNAYISGFVFMLSLAALGMFFLKTETKTAEQTA